MIIPLFVLPMTIAFIVNAYVSTKRLQEFYMAQEVEERDDGRLRQDSDISEEVEADGGIDDQADGKLPSVGYRQLSNPKSNLVSHQNSGANSYGTFGSSNGPAMKHNLPDGIAVKITDGNFVWDMESAQPTLSNINIEVPAGKLTMIVGQVGSGKSSLLSAILGEMSTVSGDVQFNSEKSGVAYGAQKAWLLNATLKDNVLFGEKLDNNKYSQVIESCALQPDIDILPAGDQTEIGEKGINLSGGQKQRVSVARTIYSSGDIVILDDPLSALDVHVGKQLFEKGILELLLEKERTVILVTHQVQYLEHADLILVMKNGMIEHQGTMDEISQVNPELYSSWQTTVKKISETEDESEDDATAEERRKLKRQLSKQVSVEEEGESGKDKSKDGKLIQKEERVRGSVSKQIYWYYMLAVRLSLCALVISLSALYNAANVGTNFWLSAWTEAGADLENATDTQLDDILSKYLSGYAGLSVTSVVLSVFASSLAMFTALLASKRLHGGMLYRVMHSPMRFFDTTPVGRILNRFSSDIQTTDMKLGQTVGSFLRFSFACLSAIVVNAIVSWYFIVAIIPIFILYLILMKFFITTSRELQRLDSISKSPVYAHFSESLGGLSTIRAYCQENRFRRSILKKIDRNNTAYIYLQTANRWLGIRLDVIGALIVLIAGLSTMIPAYFGNLKPSLVGLAITYALSMASQLNWVIRMSAEMEMNMNAVERINYYSNLKTETYEGSMYAPLDWPDKGEIQIKGISVRYAQELDAVLQDITVSFKSAEKIGICGRTGSGKSSLTLALFRVIDTFKGSIDIDGINIGSLPLTELRRRIAIIPQDPVLFTGTIRFNLDPMGDSSDDELWEAIEIAQIKDVVSDLEKGLDAMVTEGGENFSVGQRQLFCLARAFLRKTKILIMDEATASIDMKTDGILQDVVATAFKNRTVLTIAHRVSTILNSDRILVLSEGRIMEFDSPDVLLAKEDSIFSSLVKANM
ncbi:ATP-binding cassette sub-family C member 9-like [Anneissia japonica]|uniref:ATP-binding cassette sub-family C member 9-like n=1 Tax=Anneissia japonica TaxID=1529436 RepID=UPI0014257660|nr:ATP-binding cassette sub-family C member 9-like [Anneissia japonica]